MKSFARRFSKKFFGNRTEAVSDDGSADDEPIPDIPRPISKPAKVPWSLTISHDDLRKLIKGHTPRDMDDRWMCATLGPNERGEYVVQVARSWSRLTIVAIKLQAQLDGKGSLLANSSAQIKELSWETDLKKYNDVTATGESMKNLATVVCRESMHVDLGRE